MKGGIGPDRTSVSDRIFDRRNSPATDDAFPPPGPPATMSNVHPLGRTGEAVLPWLDIGS